MEVARNDRSDNSHQTCLANRMMPLALSVLRQEAVHRFAGGFRAFGRCSERCIEIL